MKFKLNENVLRVTLLFFCVIFGILSISLLALGVVYIDDVYWPRRYAGLDFLALPTLIIMLGCLSFIMSLFGCCCAKSHNKKLYIAFITSLSFIIFLELSISIISFKNMSEPKHRHIKSVMDQQMKNATQQLEEFEQHYGCCGIYGTESKCSTYSVAVVIDIENPNSPTYTTLIPDYVEGCYSVAIRVITTISRRTCTYSTVFIILQILEIIVSTCIFLIIKG